MVSDPGDQSGMRQRRGEQDVVVAPDLGVEGGDCRQKRNLGRVTLRPKYSQISWP